MKSESIGYSQTQINVITKKHSCVVSFQVQYSQHMVSQFPGQSSQESTTDPDEKTGFIWTHPATLLLISLYEQQKENFSSVNMTKKKAWELLARDMNSQGYPLNGTQCSNKWKGMLKVYKDTLAHNKKSGAGRATCPYYAVLDELLRKYPNINPLSTASSSGGFKPPAVMPNSQPPSNIPPPTTPVLPSPSCTPPPPTDAVDKAKKRKRNAEEPSWLKQYRIEAKDREELAERRAEQVAQRHNEKMEMLGQILQQQNKILELMMAKSNES